MLDLAIVWHMHQPVYRDPRSGEFILPWVRLHASRAYYDMARALEPHPEAKVHVNLVPSLLDQLDGYAKGTARDRWLELTERPATDLELVERELVWSRFFMVDWDTEINRLPRYRELLLRRGADLARVDLPRLARESTPEELRDLQVLFNLAWTGFALRAEDPALRELLARGRGFREEDKRPVLAAQQRAAQAVVPLFRALEERGQIELTTTPYYHPILPLLIDSDCARQGLPSAHLPTRFQHPEDARLQIALARDAHAARFGRRPTGMWPAEGGVSEEAAALFAEAGVTWIASDEGVLLRSLSEPARTAIHMPYRLETARGPIDLVFRDRGLSDLIGFTYAKQAPETAVANLLGHLREIDAASSGERRLVSIILDGENPWEHYPESGREFLDRLYGALTAADSPARTARLSQALPEHRPVRLSRLHAGSWIDANFRIWIGHPEDVQGWEALGKVRRALAEAEGRGLSADRLKRAGEALLMAEGSDWFWWYGDDFTTENAAEFDSLFRGYLAVACEALGIPIPPEIAGPISAAARRRPVLPDEELLLPTSVLRPVIDGGTTRFGEWSGAGRLRAARSHGPMVQGELLFAELRFGFSGSEAGPELFLRLDPLTLGPGRFSIHFELAAPAGLWILATEFPLSAATPLEVKAGPAGSTLGARLGLAAGLDLLKLSVPLGALGLKAGDRLELVAKVLRDSVEVQRLPASGMVALVVPGPEFERIHWKV